MTQISLEALGIKITREDVIDAAVEKVVSNLMLDTWEDEYGAESSAPTKYRKAIDDLVRQKVDESVNAIAARHVLPNIETYMENLLLQTTNKWGEKKGEPVTFIEYLVQRANDYIKEDVNYAGKSKDQDGYSWSKNSTRIEYLINNHLQYSIQTMIEQSLKEINASIGGGLAKAVETHVQRALEKVKVSVGVKT